MTLPNGGENVAQIACMLLIPVCLGDGRIWQWRRSSDPFPPTWRGVLYALLLTVRMQAAIIYTTAAIWKLAYPQWREGSALYDMAFNPNFGFPPGLRRLIQPTFGGPAAPDTATDVVDRAEERMLADITPEDRRTRTMLLRRCIHNLEALHRHTRQLNAVPAHPATTREKSFWMKTTLSYPGIRQVVDVRCQFLDAEITFHSVALPVPP